MSMLVVGGICVVVACCGCPLFPMFVWNICFKNCVDCGLSTRLKSILGRELFMFVCLLLLSLFTSFLFILDPCPGISPIACPSKKGRFVVPKVVQV